MSIIGMTDQAAAFPIIGTLRKGEQKTSDSNKPGKDLTVFRFVSDDPLAVDMFAQAYPDQESLRNINIVFPHKTASENLDAWIEEWVAGGLMHRCDGQTQVLYRLPSGKYGTEPRPCENCRGKQVGRLSVIIPELGRLATVTVMTTSIHDIINLSKQLRGYEAMRGDLRGIPFVLKRRQYKISTPGTNGSRLRREKWLLSIETAPHWSMLQMSAMERAALPEGDIIDHETGEVLGLPSNVSDPFDEAEFEPVESVAPAPQAEQPKPANGNGRALMEPAALKAKLSEMVERSTLRDHETKEYLAGNLHPLGEKMPNLISKLFRLVFEDSHDDDETEAEKMYHACLEWLTGADSANRLNAAAIDALLYWLVGKDNKKAMDNKTMEVKAAFRLVPSDTVIEEAQRVHREALKEARQADMFEPTPTEQDELPF